MGFFFAERRVLPGVIVLSSVSKLNGFRGVLNELIISASCIVTGVS